MNQLSGRMTRHRGQQKDNHGGNLSGSGHSFLEGNAGLDHGFFCCAVFERGDPFAVHVGEAFGDDDGVDSDVVGQEFDGPFAGKGGPCAIGGGITRGIALAGFSDFGDDVDDGSFGGLQIG